MTTPKSQVAYEFIMLVAVSFVFIFVFLLMTASQVKDIQASKESALVKDLALKLQDEISLAAFVEDGYSRNFTIPEKLDSYEFNITLSTTGITIETERVSYFVRVPEFTGNLNKGNNFIRKKEGETYANQQ